MASHRGSPPSDNENNARKRVCKACDRYVEMLEQQQQQLITALQKLYERLINNQGWKGPPLDITANGHPLTHDILERLDSLRVEGHLSPERFEENPEMLQQRLLDDEKVRVKRQPSPESDSSEDHIILNDAPSPGLPCNHPSSLSTAQLPPTPSMQKHPNFVTTSPTSYSTDPGMLSPRPIQQSQEPWLLNNGPYESCMQYYPTTSLQLFDPGQFPQEFNSCLSEFDDDMGSYSLGTMGLVRKSSMQHVVR
ncbi:MAG: hypothetical protein Q9222_002036 [Ikaeria aurantiellina]